jgi:hypothetical protein
MLRSPFGLEKLNSHLEVYGKLRSPQNDIESGATLHPDLYQHVCSQPGS